MPKPADLQSRPKNETKKLIAENRRARHEYQFSEKIEAGIMLAGTEVKSLRLGLAQLSDGYARINNGELWLENVHIGSYKQASQFNHEEKRRRKLLVHAKE